MAKKNDDGVRSTTHQYPVEGGWGIKFTGPLSKCGKEDRGSVCIEWFSREGISDGSTVMMREHIEDLHFRLGEWIKTWKK